MGEIGEYGVLELPPDLPTEAVTALLANLRGGPLQGSGGDLLGIVRLTTSLIFMEDEDALNDDGTTDFTYLDQEDC